MNGVVYGVEEAEFWRVLNTEDTMIDWIHVASAVPAESQDKHEVKVIRTTNIWQLVVFPLITK